MSDQVTNLRTVSLYAMPTESQLEEWHSLSRVEQTESVNKALDEALSSEPVELDSEQIKNDAKRRHNIESDEA